MEAVLYFKNVFLMSIYLFLDFRFVSLSLNSTKKKFHQILKNQGTVYNLPGIVANIFSFQTGLVPGCSLTFITPLPKCSWYLDAWSWSQDIFLLPHEKTSYFGVTSHSSTGSGFDEEPSRDAERQV